VRCRQRITEIRWKRRTLHHRALFAVLVRVFQ
jgi:hypothetical protein